MATDINTLFAGLEGSGVYDIVLPFIITFAVVYGLLMEMGVFGDSVNKPVSAIIGIAVAFFVAQSGVLGGFLAAFGGSFALLMMLILFLLAGAAVTGFNIPGSDDRWTARAFGAAGMFAVGALIWVKSGFSDVYGTTIPIPGLPEGIDIMSIVIIGAAIVAVYWLVSEGGGGE